MLRRPVPEPVVTVCSRPEDGIRFRQGENLHSINKSRACTFYLLSIIISRSSTLIIIGLRLGGDCDKLIAGVSHTAGPVRSWSRPGKLVCVQQCMFE